MSEVEGLARKRRKAVLACERCRERKVRCDGAMPMCGACQRRNSTSEQCLYIAENSRTTSEKAYITTLHQRISDLEGQLAGRQNPVQALASPDETSTPSHHLHSDNVFSDNDNPDRTPLVATVTRQSMPGNRLDTVGAYTSGALPSQQSLGSHTSTSFLDVRHLTSRATEQGQMSNAESPNQESPVDAMGTAIAARTHTAGPDGYYGHSSAISFLQQVQRVLRRDAAGSEVLSRQVPLFSRSLKEMTLSSASAYSLPNRLMADHMLGLYWDRVHCTFPIIHRSSFERAYEQLWRAKADEPQLDSAPDIGLGGCLCPVSVFYCALNAMFALGCNFSDLPRKDRQSMSETFAEQAIKLMQANILDQGCLALVQALLVVAQYLQSTTLPSRCWNIVGMALRAAQGLGLYMDDHDTARTILEIQIRRRTWHGCVMLDIITSMTLGRPATASDKSAVPLPAPVDDDWLESTASLNDLPHAPSENAFYVQTLKLYAILGAILTNLYDPWHRRVEEPDSSVSANSGMTDRVCAVLNLEATLSDFEANIPSYLNFKSSTLVRSETIVFRRQRNVLLTRILHTKLLLHRVMFLQMCRETSSRTDSLVIISNTVNVATQHNDAHTVLSHLIQQCSNSCIDAAVGLISLIDESSQTDAGGAWWYNIFYLFTCAMVLILAENCLPKRARYPDAAIKESWERCTKALARLTSDNPTADRYLRTLVKLRRQFVLARKDFSPAAPPINEPSPNVAPVNHEQIPPTVLRADTESFPETEPGNDVQYAFTDAQLQDILWQGSTGPPPWAFEDLNYWNDDLFR